MVATVRFLRLAHRDLIQLQATRWRAMLSALKISPVVTPPQLAQNDYLTLNWAKCLGRKLYGKSGLTDAIYGGGPLTAY